MKDELTALTETLIHAAFKSSVYFLDSEGTISIEDAAEEKPVLTLTPRPELHESLRDSVRKLSDVMRFATTYESVEDAEKEIGDLARTVYDTVKLRPVVH
ncbi:hypothetical protein F6X40_10050 [Paraburkholderia sp. UCT31]|uniref:hypothetical protein n=1 Tax=Paraburkholderia sp. UCT31 TaxID=2615209 RepID=UPI0016553037|nr:hypothetical protein [Paraburkholderia sp. UCT31]MBC8737149.1 hypothetical protein [Paraburkholderia sp. UCT31]